MLSNTELSFIFRELAFLIHGGASVADGIHLLADQEEGSALSAILRKAADDIDFGESLSSAFVSAGCFPAYSTGLIEIGEASGHLEESMLSLANYYDEREVLNNRIKNALTYPSLLLMLMFVVIVVLLAKVLPVFNEVYQSLGGQLTGVAGGLLKVGNALDAALPVLGILLGLFIIGWLVITISAETRQKLVSFWMVKNGNKGISKKMNQAHFAQALSMGLASGLPVEEAVGLAAKLLKDAPEAVKACENCKEDMLSGMEMTEALHKSDLLPLSSCKLLALGAKAGMGDTAIADIAERLSMDADQALDDKVSKIEPALVLITSLLVGAILLAVMLPLMNIMTAIG